MVGIWSRVARQTIQWLFQLKKFAPTLKNIYNLAGRTQDNGWWTANCHLWKFTFASTSVGHWSNLEKWLGNDTNSLKSLMFKHCLRELKSACWALNNIKILIFWYYTQKNPVLKTFLNSNFQYSFKCNIKMDKRILLFKYVHFNKQEIGLNRTLRFRQGYILPIQVSVPLVNVDKAL